MITPTELAVELRLQRRLDSRGAGARRVRKVARQLFEDTHVRNQPWRFTAEQANKIRQYLA